MAKKIKFVTPPGIAVYPKLIKPDTFGEYADNKFKTQIEFEPKVLAQVKKQIEALAKEFTYKVKTPKLPFKENKDGVELLVVKSKHRPTIFDAKNHKILDGWNPPNEDVLNALSIGGGSVIRVAVTPFAYDKGLSLQLESVQVIELVKGGGGSSDFDEAEGYDAFSEAENEGFGGTDSDDEDTGGEDIDL